MSDTLIIAGTGGHAKVCAEIAKLNGYKTLVFLDDNVRKVNSDFLYSNVLGTTKDIDKFDGDVFVAIGDPIARKGILEEYVNVKKRDVATLIHPNAIVSDQATIDYGVVVMPGAVINVDSAIESGSIINTCSSIDHDCKVKSYSHIAVGAHLCGTVILGENCWIGAGATVINDVRITDNVTIGAGSVVIKSINEPGTYVGTPAKMMNKNSGGVNLLASCDNSHASISICWRCVA